MKKIGMITYQDIADGKGRFLQAYALYSAISELGYDVEIIDYYPISTQEAARRGLAGKLLRMLKNPRLIPLYFVKLQESMLVKKFEKELLVKRNKYEEFIEKNIKITEEKYHGYQALQGAKLEYDAYICGSDQIWNPYFQGMDPTYYLNFAPKQKRIAYAPSLGTTEIEDNIKEFLKLNIKEMPYLSVREESGAKLVSELIGRDVNSVLDPTFLMSREWWNDLASEVVSERPYILTFLFDNSSYPRKVTKEIAHRNGYDVISIPDSFADIFFQSHKEVSISPERFVSLFKNASFICTQSFHGTVLSLIYNRPFYVFDRQTKAYVSGVFSRIRDLLDKVELTDRILKPGQYIPEDLDSLDFGQANSLINIERNKSIEYLKNALAKATECE